MIFGQSGYVHSLYNADLAVQRVSVEEDVAMIELAGGLSLVGTCGDARMEAQILHTVSQFLGFDSALITVNGTNFKQFFDVSGTVGTNELYQLTGAQ